MVEAYLVRYEAQLPVRGDAFGERLDTRAAKAVYVPGEQIIVLQSGHSDILSDSVANLYSVYIGPIAVSLYSQSVQKSNREGFSSSSRIEVTEQFIDWAKKMYEVHHPSKEISDLLGNFF